VTVGAQEVTV
jgi:hypothetical protein